MEKYRPGEIVPKSGDYRAYDKDGQDGGKLYLEKGKRFPATQSSGSYYKLGEQLANKKKDHICGLFRFCFYLINIFNVFFLDYCIFAGICFYKQSYKYYCRNYKWYRYYCYKP